MLRFLPLTSLLTIATLTISSSFTCYCSGNCSVCSLSLTGKSPAHDNTAPQGSVSEDKTTLNLVRKDTRVGNKSNDIVRW